MLPVPMIKDKTMAKPKTSTANPTASLAALRGVAIFGALGYMSVLMQWLWMGVTIIFPLISSSGMSTYFLPSEQQQAQQAIPAAEIAMPGWLQITLVVAAVLFTIAVTIYAIVAVPRTVGRIGKTVVQRSAKVAIPHLTHHRPVTAARRKTLVERITWSIKLVFVFIPLIALLVPTPPSVGLEHRIVLACGLFFGSWSLLMFGIQYVIARAGRVDPRQVW